LTPISAGCQRFWDGGATELALSLGLSRLIVHLVDFDRTLKVNGLVVTETIAKVSSRLIVNLTAPKIQPKAIGALIEGLRTALEQG
jgi:ATP phosphoribosyltransferase